MTTRTDKGNPLWDMSWAQYDHLMDELAYSISTKRSLTQFQAILGIPRGGLVVAVSLSHRLNLELVQTADWFMADKVLVVDDICDTGQTLDGWRLHATATLLVRDNLPLEKYPLFWGSTVRPDMHVRFPWETEESTF